MLIQQIMNSNIIHLKMNCPICNKELVRLEPYKDSVYNFWCDDCNTDIVITRKITLNDDISKDACRYCESLIPLLTDGQKKDFENCIKNNNNTFQKNCEECTNHGIITMQCMDDYPWCNEDIMKYSCPKLISYLKENSKETIGEITNDWRIET